MRQAALATLTSGISWGKNVGGLSFGKETAAKSYLGRESSNELVS